MQKRDLPENGAAATWPSSPHLTRFIGDGPENGYESQGLLTVSLVVSRDIHVLVCSRCQVSTRGSTT